MLLVQKQAGTSQAAAAQTAAPSIFDLKPGAQFELQSGIQLHMFVSQPPCGDACICIPSSNAQQSSPCMRTCPQPAAPQYSTTDPSGGHYDACGPAQCATEQQPATQSTAVKPEEHGSPNLQSALVATKSIIQDGQTSALDLQNCQNATTLKRHSVLPHNSSKHPAIRTGAKRITPIPHSVSANSLNTSDSSQSMQPLALQLATVPYEQGQQATGVLRRKPGRGDATLSMSCSDKLAKWCCLGVQVIPFFLCGMRYLSWMQMFF